jgi:protein TonB
VKKDGVIEVMGVRAPHEALEAEARRVVNALPKVQPGVHSGEEVAVLYSLPITFKLGE